MTYGLRAAPGRYASRPTSSYQLPATSYRLVLRMLSADWLTCFFGVQVALVLHDAVHVPMPVDRHLDRPRAREHLRVGHRRAVGDDILRRPRQALDHLQRVAVEVAGAIEPGLVVQAYRLDDERLALPAAARVAHPRFVSRIPRQRLQRYPAPRVDVLRKDRDLILGLQNLEGQRQIHRSGYASEVALLVRILGLAV